VAASALSFVGTKVAIHLYAQENNCNSNCKKIHDYNDPSFSEFSRDPSKRELIAWAGIAVINMQMNGRGMNPKKAFICKSFFNLLRSRFYLNDVQPAAYGELYVS
jgi:hypothetical protein